MATREHDNGWREADSAPWLDAATHRPYDFTTYPEEGRLDLWRRGILRFAQEEPTVALLIAEHAEHVHRPLSATWRSFFEELEPLRHGWQERSGVDRTTLLQDYRYLEIADSLSLALCMQQTGRLECQGVEAWVEGDRLQLDPFPLAGTTTFQIPVRRIESQTYRSDRQIAAALARARWQRWSVRVAPRPLNGA